MAALLACTRKGTPNLVTLWINLFLVTVYHRKTAPILLLLVDFICFLVHILIGWCFFGTQ